MRSWKPMVAGMLLLAIIAACSPSSDSPHEDHDAVEEKQEEATEEQVDRRMLEGEAVTPPHALREEASNHLQTLQTKNMTRLAENDPISFAIQLSQMGWPATHEQNQPNTVILASVTDWRASLASLTLVHHPNNGPMLYYDGTISDEVIQEIARLDPLGNDQGAEILIIGDLPQAELDKLSAYTIAQITADSAPEYGKLIEESFIETIGDVPQAVLVGSLDEDAKGFTIPAAYWIAHMNESLLFVEDGAIPKETVEALEARGGEAIIYLLGPEAIISENVASELEAYGEVNRIEGDTPVEQAIAFSSYKDEATDFGWDITSPGHGLVFSSTNDAELAIAAAPLAHLGKHSPLIWLDDGELTQPVYEYLAKLKPVFADDPTEGPYNHGYIIGDVDRISYQVQGVIDERLEIVSAHQSDEGHHH
ncbi:cell wall-binding repeat-containing protein [Halalkalibacterium halodurans]|uniref:cell wall-binding repeat-containing protein n=1 Tax=Halalkalibacterium halodurans TaxID=86665 RepID=UPI002E201A99|nr:cell wall-binding repeat-containing protein [Halalkalibacterium halodurans]MED4085135.1 cell wall-binding repeat-containing protein [Halalkalibacterium halodurans]MED4105287.1 cell wall-binding repeat-containing protein [Halalkalibacterium halodurans]MED4109096.1 cell wall-binding repeat-containing protein [Halalkalibacterium halodurans]MED4148994.1 cell wall-binding repeat-containing protein [Halalkalibacterium halodurans]